MWQKIKQLKEERAAALGRMKAILQKSQDEKRDLTDADNTEFDTLNTTAEQRQQEIERYERAQNLESSLAAQGKGEQRIGREDLGFPEKQAEQKTLEQRAQVDRYLRTGVIENNETRAVTVSGSGVVGDRPIYSQLITAIKTFAGVREAGATVLPTTDGNDLSVPTGDDTTNTAQIVGEAVTDNSEIDPTIGTVTLKNYKFDSKWIKVSTEMLNDSAYPLESYILGIAGERIGRGFNAYSTTGTGTSQPKGFLVGGTLGKTAASSNAITYEELLDTFHSIDAGYRNSPNFAWQLHDTTLAAIRKLKNGSGQYIFDAGAGGAPPTILNKKYIVNNSMPQLTDGVNSKVLAVGDWSRYFVRDVTQVTIVRASEIFAGDGLVGFRIFSRHDGQLTDAKSVKYLQLAAA